MARNSLTKIGIFGCLIVSFGFTLVEGRTSENFQRPAPPETGSLTTPAYCNTYHNVGRIALGISNDGTFATGLSSSGSATDCFTNETLPDCEFPKGSRTRYCFGAALWIGAISGRDTLVSTGADGWSITANEFHPDFAEYGGGMTYRSTIDPASAEYENAVSEQDYICQYRDTCHSCRGVTNDELDNRPHIPLNLEITQRTYAWSYAYAQDFVLFDYGITNIGDNRLRRVYMGFYVDADIHDLANQTNGAQDDLNGFREKQPALYMKSPCPVDSDVVNIAWTADNDGDMAPTQVTYQQVPHITAVRIIRTPSDSLQVSFNWWISNGDARYDYGPQKQANARDYSTGGTGTPTGDRNKFFILSNGDFDFDQARTGQIDVTNQIWVTPTDRQRDSIPRGLDTRYLLSFGPFDIDPGQTLPISLAYVAGKNFHKNFSNFANLPLNPDSWYEGVNFDSLGSNATWADWVYDNPGVDTDSDGYAGEYTICVMESTLQRCDTTETDTICYYDYTVTDTIWRKGDGVPDFRGATPPPAPSSYSTTDANGVRHNGLRVEAKVGQLTIKWNGTRSESTEDVFSRTVDFEGYRVYMSRDERASSYSVLASYDIEDYNRWEFNYTTTSYELKEAPFTLHELRCLYAPDSCSDTLWNPLDYPRSHPLIVDGLPGTDPAIFYFEPQDFNQSILGNEPNAQTAIRKIYPDAPRPAVLEPDSIRILFPDTWSTYLTDEGFIKYFEYEYTINNLLPTVPYWVNVTAFDYGSPSSGLASLETSPTLLPEVKYPLDESDPNNPNATPVFVWPNPYRLDADYRDHGFEGRGLGDKPIDRVRLIHFANLPEKCTISIYSLDGDLVRQFEHPNQNLPNGCAGTKNEGCWDLITRNSQQVVSGIYYWTVEDDKGNVQIGKMAIIL
jgi:hypothetical protein